MSLWLCGSGFSGSIALAQRSADEPVAHGASGVLSLHIAGETCVAPLDPVIVTLDVADLPEPINGVQALIHYDPSVLTLQNAVSESPWLQFALNDTGGNIIYAAIIPAGSRDDNHTIATLSFVANAGVDANTTVSFQPDGAVVKTKLTIASDSSTLLPNKISSQNLFVGLPDCLINTEDEVCANTSGHNASVPDAGAGATYQWQIIGGAVQSGQGTTSIVYSAGAGPGATIEVVVVDGNGCEVQCVSDVIVHANPIASASNDGPVCAGDNVELFGDPAGMSSYSWTGPVGFTSALRDTVVSPAVAGTYTLTVESANGCIDSTGTTVQVESPPACAITVDASVCPRSSGNIATVPDAGPGADYDWDVTGGTVDSAIGRTIQFTTGDGPTVTISVTVTDADGCVSFCERMVEVSSASVTVDIELEALNGSTPEAPVSRVVTFEITECGGSVDPRMVPVTVDESGAGSVVLTDVNLDATWITAKEGHTLRQLQSIVFDDCGSATVEFTGDDRLVSGDLHTDAVQQDDFIDIVDFSVLAAAWGTAVDPNSSIGADVTGDGVQDTADFTAIQVNYFLTGDANSGCAVATRSRTDLFPHHRKSAPRGRVSVRELPFSRAHFADVTGDGFIDTNDIVAFAARHGLPIVERFREKLRQPRGDSVELKSNR